MPKNPVLTPQEKKKPTVITPPTFRPHITLPPEVQLGNIATKVGNFDVLFKTPVNIVRKVKLIQSKVDFRVKLFFFFYLIAQIKIIIFL